MNVAARESMCLTVRPPVLSPWELLSLPFFVWGNKEVRWQGLVLTGPELGMVAESFHTRSHLNLRGNRDYFHFFRDVKMSPQKVAGPG